MIIITRMPSNLRSKVGPPAMCGLWCHLASTNENCRPQLVNAQTGICDIFLLQWPRQWPDDLHIRIWPMSREDISDVRKRTSYVKAFKSYRLTDIQMPSKLYTTPLRGWAIINRYFWHARHTMKNHHKDACGNQTIQAYCQNKNVLSECLKQTSFDYDTLRTKLQR